MKYRMIHNLLKCEIRFLAGIIFCSLLSLENGMAQNQPERLLNLDVPQGRWSLIYYIISKLGFGAEYSARWMWKGGARGKCDHQFALKMRLKFGLNKKKRF